MACTKNAVIVFLGGALVATPLYRLRKKKGDVFIMENLNQELNEINKNNELLFQNSNARKGFVERHYEPLKWTISVYHVFFALWAAFLFLKSILPAINMLVFAIPLIFFIATSAIGSYRLLKNKTNAYNYLIAAQIPQVIILQLNGFVYFLLIGQWIILRIGGGQLFGINFGLLDAKYSLLFGNAKEIGFLFGINILPIILILILLKMEEIEEERHNKPEIIIKETV